MGSSPSKIMASSCAYRSRLAKKIAREFRPVATRMDVVLNVITVVEGTLVALIVHDVVGQMVVRAWVVWVYEDVLGPVSKHQ